MSDKTNRPARVRDALAVGEFRAIWLAELQSVLGDQIARLALSVLVFQRTNSAAWSTLTYALTYLPDLVGGPLLGGLADRYPRRTVMVTCDVVRATLVATMAIPGFPLPLLAVVLVVVQLANAPFNSAQASVMPTVLVGDDYVVGQSLLKVTNQIGQLAGFAAGGAVIAALGADGGLAIDATTFVVSAAVIRWGVHSRPASGATGDEPISTLRRLVAGVSTIRKDPRLRTLVAAAWLAGFVIVPEGLAVPFAAEIGGGSTAAGFLLAAHPAGIALGASLLGKFVPPAVRLRIVGPLAIGAIVPLLGFAFRPPIAVAIVLLVLSGSCAAYQVIASTTFMRLVPDAERGQAFGLAGSGLIAVQGIGLLVAGILVSVLHSPARTVAVIAAAGVLFAVPIATTWRRARLTNPL
ncbi:MAG: major facilitator superfamily protein [Amycolatopsis sp.]|uniref:MFS transporter n=1 Tax=Amycolatopsis sp. TaxID=37632 RepID=UPI002631F75D|nr:MFS transporter [Amycolatopsis sp.]MCU1680329.1 major facilitator superfamily protein [Amycolatopsis sp.]